MLGEKHPSSCLQESCRRDWRKGFFLACKSLEALFSHHNAWAHYPNSQTLLSLTADSSRESPGPLFIIYVQNKHLMPQLLSQSSLPGPRRCLLFCHDVCEGHLGTEGLNALKLLSWWETLFSFLFDPVYPPPLFVSSVVGGWRVLCQASSTSELLLHSAQLLIPACSHQRHRVRVRRRWCSISNRTGRGGCCCFPLPCEALTGIV